MNETDLFKKFSVSEPAPFSSKISIYIAEQHSELRLIINHRLEKLGFRNIRHSRDGRTTLAHLQNESSDIIIAGDNLVDIPGLELLKELKENLQIKRNAFLLISKPLNKSEVMLAIEHGTNELLIRPVVVADVVPKIKSAYYTFNNPKNPERLYELAKQKIREKNLQCAEDIYVALSNTAINAARPLVGLAKIKFLEKNYDMALNLVSQGIARNENYVHALALRAEIYLQINEINNAIVDLKKAIDLSPLNIARLENCCEILITQELIEPCIEILQKSLNAGLKHAYITERLGYCYFLLKKYDFAEQYLREAIKLAPDNMSYLNSLAICYRDAKKYDDAIIIYNQILKKDQNNHLVLFNKALVFLYKDNKIETVRILKKIIKIMPSYDKAREKLQELGEVDI